MTKSILTEQKQNLLKAGEIKLIPVAPTPFNGGAKFYGPPPTPTCFVAGSLVLMADMSWKAIETITVGEWMWSVNGPVQCVEEHVTRLGARQMITFADQSLFWSDEHAFWTRDMLGAEWWWSYNADTWRQEVNDGAIGGLLDNYSIRTGEIAISYAHIDGWKLQKSQIAVGDFNEYTPLFLPATHGAPIVVNGYLVGACVNEKNFDYASIKWSAVDTYRETNILEEI
jgi:hypothetical protein